MEPVRYFANIKRISGTKVLSVSQSWNAICYANYNEKQLGDTVKPVCNDHLYNKIYYLWLIQ